MHASLRACSNNINLRTSNCGEGLGRPLQEIDSLNAMLCICVQSFVGMLEELPMVDGCGNSLVSFLSDKQRQELGRYIAGKPLYRL